MRGPGIKDLYEIMAGAPAPRVDELVPPGEKPTVIYEGRNSLPVFSRFQKRLARIGEEVVLYNQQFFHSPLDRGTSSSGAWLAKASTWTSFCSTTPSNFRSGRTTGPPYKSNSVGAVAAGLRQPE